MRSVVCLLVLAPAFVSAQSAPKLDGAPNFRDIGGLKTADGSVVRHGLIFRSGELSGLTPGDYQALAPLNIRYIFDLRTDAERASAPTKWNGSQPAIMPVPVGFAAVGDPDAAMRQMFSQGVDPAHAMAAMKALTAQIAVDGAPEIGKVLQSLARGQEPAIVHCTAGKDRAGMVTAVLLQILGVPRDAILQDYLRSNDAAAAEMARLRASAGTSPGASSPLAQLPPETIKVLMGVDRSYFDAAFAAIDAKYGSFDAYVTQGLKLTPADVESLRSRLLEKEGGRQ
jgi:protein-tyrosine phosphatase